MAGHSKWSNIKRKKGKEDAVRGKIFTKLTRYITVAVKEGGSDPEYNPALKAAIEKAKAENMPNDNIDRAIKKAAGSQDADNFEEIKYEGYGPAGIAVYVSCLTDNRNRTASDVRHAFDKFGGNLGQTGCVSFMFDRKGILAIEKNDSIDEEELMMEAIEIGAEDFNVEEEVFEIITAPEDFNTVRDTLKEKGYEFVTAETSFIPQNTVELKEEKDIKNMVKLIENLEDNDDVQDVYHNWEIPDDLEIE
ncbi:YebC/PmpR family DNA-binding transcriptional regulator [Anaerosalibacter bizertensis]|uniref:Probable transcriptional regulatory protein FYJ27_05860 n=1 Tax=Anaerosalibacter bizertensis TaxID=932217 RepID=A0A844FGT5_9FIRM|nr:YebC/PmpR family DNA-binding transcriptional regulator [Anaerosalibacter bizertensis]MBV1820363.1 YebC/PmpR family DNA-binding transcriptional regulator [Bacteroidales bacterium MSK.15.36]HHV25969.1 YebC/PmpR family DNA-binding transcriptional regulator [Tissierellia bacterium]MBU5293875.1 YebC/PmpR family DNA-binding transcriptional regulator [Anaerosalibacter bizertensis]MCB5559726.1 YebC/PmpR family DNA-binding transcriptional regulator [Anaerosalibacter bizertensis]MCG4564723.1 YebC/Pmp